ncbi:MAG: hypothetical protein JJU15_11940 [Pararhodobacter sp.]|nr:hypothetical protein [Pararhodobacter sp.]
MKTPTTNHGNSVSKLTTMRWLKTAFLIFSAAFALILGTATQSHASGESCPVPQSYTLWAGQTNDVGEVIVSNTATHLTIKYMLNEDERAAGTTFGTLHAWVGTDLEGLPTNPQGILVPGSFPYSHTPSSDVWHHTFSIPLNTLGITDLGNGEGCGLELIVVTHAEINYADGRNNGNNDTAFGGDNPGDGPRWWFYITYEVQCCDDTPPVFGRCETAFGYGTHIFATNRNHNPDDLPTLRLSPGRWGWANRVGQPNTIVRPIYAGAGRNITRPNRVVGELTIERLGDGSVRVGYEMNRTRQGQYNRFLHSVHIYASNDRPTTIAPGRYGYTRYFGGSTVGDHSATFQLDAEGPIWIIAHAVVCWPR